MKNLVIGVDYGTDSARALIVDAATGEEISQSVFEYPRWKKGLYCKPEIDQFRQHPLDYLEALEGSIKNALNDAPAGTAENVKAITVDMTGSTPGLIGKDGNPLALSDEFAENPQGMFVLWKDHTGVDEADEINQKSRTWGGIDFTSYSGGIYSSEWFWAKGLRAIRQDEKIKDATYTIMECSDWIPAVLTGYNCADDIKRNRCGAGHKGMWHESWGGYPSADFLTLLDPKLAEISETLPSETFVATEPIGTLCADWASKLGLPESVIITNGILDAHAGAIGGGVKPGTLLKVIGTSTCDMMVSEPKTLENVLIKGICGQVDGSMIPNFIGLEAGQSAFGDLYAWFVNIIEWPLRMLPEAEREKHAGKIIGELAKAAEELEPTESSIVALDWVNGRRTPDANQKLTGLLSGLKMGSDAPAIFKALVEATAYGSRAIAERIESEGVKITDVAAIGGVAKKSALVMQTLADVMNVPIHVIEADQACALGSAMMAATAAGIYPDLLSAQAAMASKVEASYEPNPVKVEVYNKLYAKYQQLGKFVESTI